MKAQGMGEVGAAMASEGNLNQPPQQPGGMGGDTTAKAIAEPQSPEQMMQQPSMAAPEGVNPNTIPAQANPETGQMG